jgi:Xaa-Pro dipeptidase
MRRRDDLSFTMDEYEARLEALRARLYERQLDAMLVTSPENTTYLTGFESPGHYWFQGLLVPVAWEPICVSRALEGPGVDAYSWIEHNWTYRDEEEPMVRVTEAIAELGLHGARIGYERDGWFFTASQQDALFALAGDVVWIDASLVVEQGRLVKSDAEITLMREAAISTAAGMQAGIAAAGEGVSEDEIAAQMHLAMIRAGSEWPAIAPFVASGERGAIGHATWRGRKLRHQDPVFLELAGCRRRYHVAMLRTVFVGEADDEALEAFELVRRAFDAAMDAIRPGVAAGDVDKAARDLIADSPFGGTHASRCAYSIGIALPPDWGEGQILSMKPGETRPLAANMTFHLLPWVQLPGRGAIGCTETIRVTETGVEALTYGVTRELIVV